MKRKPNARQKEAQRRAELRRLRAAAREPRPVQEVYVRTYVRRPLWSRALTVSWLIVIGILIGGGMIPHVEDRPYFDTEPETAVAAPPAPPKRPGSVLTAPAPEEEPLPMSYSWAAEKDAQAYRIAFYRDGQLVRVEVTNTPSIELSLPTGDYQWIVWPIDGRGVVKSKAIVNSTVTTP